MKQLDEIIYDAIRADSDLLTDIGSRVVSTCFEVPPGEDDNTPLPNVVIMDEGLQNTPSDKDSTWEASEDSVTVSVEVSASSPKEVKRLLQRIRQAVRQHIATLSTTEDVPILESLTSEGLAWDWTKPCYYQKITYNCVTINEDDDEQE